MADIDDIDLIMRQNYERREKFLKALVDDVEDNDTDTLKKNARIANELMTAQETSSLTKRKIETDDKMADALAGGVAQLLTGNILGMLTIESSEADITKQLEIIDVDIIPTESHVTGEDELEAEPLDPKKILEEI